jgi:flavin-dependent dehydrogenase
MYFSDRGYVGLSRLGNGVTNICALFRNATHLRKSGPRGRNDFSDLFAGSMGAELRARLSDAQFLEGSFAAVAGFSLKRERFLRNECRVGDSLCMIPPMTGNGMSIALETASIAAPLLREYHHGAAGWRDTVDAIARSCETTLRRRLFSAGVLQSACFSRTGRLCLLATMRAAPRLFSGCFWLTR